MCTLVYIYIYIYQDEFRVRVERRERERERERRRRKEGLRGVTRISVCIRVSSLVWTCDEKGVDEEKDMWL